MKGENSTKINIRNEFIERDLYNASDLKEVQWRIKDTGLTKDGLKELLEKPNVRESIKDYFDFNKINQLFGTSFDETSSSSELSQAVIDYFNNESNFKKIFKVIY